MINRTIYILGILLFVLVSCSNDEDKVNYGYKVVAKIQAYARDFQRLPDSLSQLIPYYIPSEDSAHLVTHFKYSIVPYDPADTLYYPNKKMPREDYFYLEMRINKKYFTYYKWNMRTKNFDLVWF